MFGRKKAQPVQVEQVVRTITVREDSPEAVQMRERQDAYIAKATDEYARLSARVSEGLDAKESGQFFSQWEIDRDLSAMNVLADSIAFLTGKDRIVVGFQMDQQARGRRQETFPYNSFLSGSSLLWPEKV